MPMEFLHGRPLSPEEIEIIRWQIEEGFEVIGAVDDEIRGIVARDWPTCWPSFHTRKIDVARNPEPPSQPATWTIYRAAIHRAASKAIRLGEVEATDEHEAIEKAAERFKAPAAKLIARLRQ